MKYERSRRCFRNAQKVIPGGVNSPARSFGAVSEDPLFVSRGDGARIYDEDGNEYIDYVGSWGPLILGHAPPVVTEALHDQLEKGTSFGAPTELETKLASLVCTLVPSIEKVRMVNSGTEATMSALRLARGYTGRDKIIKFAGCYHGHGDSLLVQAGSGASTLGEPDSPGVTEGTARDTISLPFNDTGAVERAFERHPEDIAAVIVEPVAGNMGVIEPQEGFLPHLREVTEEHGAVLIFDEVMTGFRVALGGAQDAYDITPDITCLGKVIGGGLPVGAYGGKEEIMACVSPEGAVYQAGTLSGNPLAMRAGLETLRTLAEPGIFEKILERSRRLEEGIQENLRRLDLDFSFRRAGTMWSLFFTSSVVRDYEDVTGCDMEMYASYFSHMLDKGIYLPPSQFESAFVSLAHGQEEIERTIEANYEALKALK